MCIFCATSLAKILHLHYFWEQRNVHSGRGSFCEVVAFENLFILIKVLASIEKEMARYKPDERHPYASISGGISVDPWVSLPATFALSPGPLSIVDLQALLFAVQSLLVPPPYATLPPSLP